MHCRISVQFTASLYAFRSGFSRQLRIIRTIVLALPLRTRTSTSATWRPCACIIKRCCATNINCAEGYRVAFSVCVLMYMLASLLPVYALCRSARCHPIVTLPPLFIVPKQRCRGVQAILAPCALSGSAAHADAAAQAETSALDTLTGVRLPVPEHAEESVTLCVCRREL